MVIWVSGYLFRKKRKSGYFWPFPVIL